MLQTGAVRAFARKAQQEQGPALYGIFAETDLKCAMLWRYLEEYAETCDHVTMNIVQQEVTFGNGAGVRVFCSVWRTYYGMRFDDVLVADESIRAHVFRLIDRRSGKVAAYDETPRPVFGL